MKASGTYSYLNLSANVLVVVVSATLIGSLAYRVFFQQAANPTEAQLLKAGDSFKGLQEVDFSKSRYTVLIALDTKCSYCDLSIPFYKKVIAESIQNPGTRVIALFDNGRAEVEDYLREHELDVEFITNAELVKTRVDMTPTIVVVDTNRAITASYEGKLQEKQEQDLFEVLEKNASAP